ncbi:hypothetical protein JB92DRAFT_2946928, partial [Gautieria morchelliformis]
RPPIDGTLTVDQLCYWHRVHSPRVAAFVFPKENGLQTTLTSKALQTVSPRERRLYKALFLNHRARITGYSSVILSSLEL